MRPLSVILGCAGLITGLILMGTCGRSGWSGALIGVGSILVVLIVTIFFVGSVYLLTRMSDDIRALRQRAETSRDAIVSDRRAEPPDSAV